VTLLILINLFNNNLKNNNKLFLNNQLKTVFKNQLLFNNNPLLIKLQHYQLIKLLFNHKFKLKLLKFLRLHHFNNSK